jgi:hypothetical protein
MIEAAFTILYVLGALLAMGAFIHGGYWREARSESGSTTILLIVAAFWPVFTLCITYTVARKVIKHKRAARPLQGEK